MQFESCQCGHGLAGFDGVQFQQGHGLTGFEGVRYQKGYGLWGSLFKLLKPALKFLGRQALGVAGGVATDVLAGTAIKESAKNRLKNSALEIAEKGGEKAQALTQKGINKAMTYIKQKGSGRRRRRVVCAKLKRKTKSGKAKKRQVGKTKKRGRPRKYKKRTSAKKQFDFLQ